ncbi:hypothetical protein GRF29_8g3530187 [Pseudopithomyces chartarum]|uniref:Uncharacterized protein n=1 Tax=Pseudopithomyces chartarum TaxID=1892770 RepID=A0AAN6M911_9PLEO|nr:hypothetical protein GRF29_8g3530187 [Pseudopithomyces chartarum]
MSQHIMSDLVDNPLSPNTMTLAIRPKSPTADTVGGDTPQGGTGMPDDTSKDGAGHTSQDGTPDDTSQDGSDLSLLAALFDGVNEESEEDPGLSSSDEDASEEEIQVMDSQLRNIATAQCISWDTDADGPDYSELAKSITVDGFLPIIDAIWDDEINADSPMTKSDDTPVSERRFGFRKYAGHTLCSMPEELIQMLISGNMHRKNISSEVSDYLRDVKGFADQQPSIYVRSFVDKEGDSPSVDMLMRLVKFVDIYCSCDPNLNTTDVDKVYRFDDELGGQTPKHLIQAGGRKLGNIAMQKLQLWAAALKRRCDRVNKSQWNQPLPDPPLTYAGYSKHALLRLESHKKLGASTTNKVLSAYFGLFEDAKSYKFEYRIVCLVADRRQAALAEITIAAITRSNMRHGGCCVGHPGVQMGQHDEKTDWSQFQQNIMEYTPVKKNWEIEAARAKGFIERNDSVRKGMLQLQTQIAHLEKATSQHAKVADEFIQTTRRLQENYNELVNNGVNKDTMIMTFIREKLCEFDKVSAQFQQTMDS